MGQHKGALISSAGNVLKQRSPGSHCPFVKRPVTSTADPVDLVGSLCIDLMASPSLFFTITDGSVD